MRLDTLNPSQLAAVTHGNGPLLVLAGAGTGKTRVITYRIAHLIRFGADPARILALSFTNKAAREVAERVSELVGKERGDAVNVSTFHSLGLSILKTEAKKIGLPPAFSLATEGERRSIIRQVAKETAPELDAMAVGDMISRWKNRGMTAAMVREAKEPVSRSLVNSYGVYEGFMKAQAAVDFDDLLLLPLLFLSSDPVAREAWRGRFSHIMVDEYQDTNRVQFELLRQLVNEKRNLAVVGDDDQSIYGWRGAEVELILRFPDHFPGCATVVLEENYRSTPVILDAAHAVASRLVSRHEKKLRVAEAAEGKKPEPIHFMESEDEEREAEEIASAILAERFRTNRPWSHFAVLYRTNSQSRPFEQAFRVQEIPHIVVGGSRFFDHKEARDVLSYLKVLLNPKDDAALMRIANVPKRGLGHQTMIRLKEEATASGVSMLMALEAGEGLTPQARAGAKSLAAILGEFRQRFKSEGLTPGGLEDFIKRLNLKADVEANYESARAVKMRLEILDGLTQTVEAAMRGKRSIPLDEFIESMTLDPPAEKNGEEEEAVRLMTLHSAKGLEFPIVYLAGMEEGLMPLKSQAGEDAERDDEERRLCYVGITRAKTRLTLSRALVRKRNGTTRAAAPSRFLAEIPAALTEKGGQKVERSKEEEEKLAENFFENIRKMLATK